MKGFNFAKLARKREVATVYENKSLLGEKHRFHICKQCSIQIHFTKYNQEWLAFTRNGLEHVH